MAKKLEIIHASQILTNDRQILVLSNSYLITTVIKKNPSFDGPHSTYFKVLPNARK